jgi:hypothetical protein
MKVELPNNATNMSPLDKTDITITFRSQHG